MLTPTRFLVSSCSSKTAISIAHSPRKLPSRERHAMPVAFFSTRPARQLRAGPNFCEDKGRPPETDTGGEYFTRLRASRTRRRPVALEDDKRFPSRRGRQVISSAGYRVLNHPSLLRSSAPALRRGPTMRKNGSTTTRQVSF